MKDGQHQFESLSENFADALKKARGDRSQAEFARFLGIPSQATYQRYESGRIPDGDVLYQIATHIGVSMEELLTGRRPPAAETEEGMRVIGESAFPLKADLNASDEELETALHEIAASIPGSVRPAKKILLRNISQLIHELEKRYITEDEHWRDVRKRQSNPAVKDLNSELASEAAAVSRKAEALGLDHDQESQHSGGAASPTAHKSKPSSSSSKDSKNPPSPPGQAPK